MDAREYIETYRNLTNRERLATVGLRGDLVIARGYPVSRVEIRSIDELRALGLVWYLNRLASPLVDVGWDHADASRTTVGDAADLIESTYSFRKEGIEKAGATIGEGPLVLPAFRVPGSRAFLIDGCHRAVFAALYNLDIVFDLDVLEGENDEALLPDSTVPDAPEVN